MNVTLILNNQTVTMPWEELAKMLTRYECESGTCFSEIASASSLDIFYLLMGAFFVFIMQAGFSFLEVGCVHVKNTKNILTKNIGDACIGAIAFYVLGYGFAFGGGNSFIGNSGFVLQGDGFEPTKTGSLYDGKNYANWLYQWAFAATASTIVSGAVAERIAFSAYIVYSTCLSAFIYPVIVHWAWSPIGWASAFNTANPLFGVGAIDFAGSGVVHMTGGMAALVGCITLGPRMGRFDGNGRPVTMPMQSVFFQTLGTLILWFGWYGFNCMSTGTLKGNASDVAAKVAVNLTLCTAMAGITSITLSRFWNGNNIIDTVMGNNGILAGAVSITAGCAVLEPELAVLTGFIGGILYVASSKLIIWFRIDDVVDAVPVHLVCGAWGLIAPGLFASSKSYTMAYGGSSCGLFYSCNGNGGKQLGAQLVFILALAAWVGITCLIMFLILKKLHLLRVPEEVERVGLDQSEHGGHAYHYGKGHKLYAITDSSVNEPSQFVIPVNSEYEAVQTPVANAASTI